MVKVAIINDTRVHNHYGCLLVMSNLEKLLEKNGFSVEWCWPVHKDWRLYKNEILDLPKVDLVIVNGEGTINNSHKKKYAKALTEFAKFSHDNISQYCYLVNSTLYNNSQESYDELKYYRAIFVRDSASLEELKSNGCEGRFVPDLTFYKYSGDGVNFRSGEGICVTDNTIRSMAVRLKKYALNNNFNYITMHLAHPKNKSFLKSPRTFFKNTWNWWFEDRYRSSEPQSYIDQLKRYQLIITGRFHTVTMCLKNRIPFVAISSNTPKIEHLLDDVFGARSRVFSIGDIEKNNYSTKLDYSEIELMKLDEFMLMAQIRIEETFVAIKKDFVGRDIDNVFIYPESLGSKE